MNRNIFFLFLIQTLITSCKHDPAMPIDKQLLTVQNTDSFLYLKALQTEGYTWYKFSDEYLNKSTNSGHSEPWSRTRFNQIASSQLNSLGKVKDSIIFPEESFIVKELYTTDKKVNTYAILYKKPDHPFADENGWVWGYVDANGKPRSEASNLGGSCRGCHTQSGNIDLLLMNVSHP